MRAFILAVSLGFAGSMAVADQSVLVKEPNPVVVSAPVSEKVVVSQSCRDGRCYVVREPRFERNVSVETVCDGCGVKETTRTVTRTRRRR